MNKVKFCIPIIKPSKSEVLDVIKKNKNDYDFFEVWMDYVEDLDNKFLKNLEKDLGSKLLLLFRRQNLEKPKMSPKRKLEVINLLKNSNVFFDFDIYSQKKELEYVKANKIKVNKILSYHNYKMTPDDNILLGILRKMKKYEPDVYKISTFCKVDKDAVRLMKILANLRSKKLNHIILGMGEKGMITRVYGMLMGNVMNFAPKTLAEKSAPGQLARTELESILKIMQSQV